MTTKTVMLEQAITRWKNNAAATTLQDFHIGWGGCSFCQAYYAKDCAECPIKAKTGKSYCRGTPYQEAATGVWFLDLPAAKAGAVKMVEFLQGLLGSV